MNALFPHIRIYVVLAFAFLNLNVIQAEGTKQLSPTAADEAMLHTAATNFGNFAAFDGPAVSRLHVRIDDFSNEILYIGLSAEADDNGILPTAPTSGSYQFRIVAPDGTVVHGPFTINAGNSNCPTWALASTGPAVLFPGGYSTAASYATFNPATAPGAQQNGDYRIEFMDVPPSLVNIKWFDFTVAKAGVETTGRLWSYNWVLRTPQIAVTPPECGWDRPFNGEFFTYTDEGFVSKVDFSSSGFQGLTFIVAFGDSGPGNTGNVEEDRKSLNSGTPQQIGDAADHMVFVSEPDPLIFTTPNDLCGTLTYNGLTCDTGGYCLNVTITKPGLVEILLDFFGDNGEYDAGTADVLLAEYFNGDTTACLYWDGLKGDGSPLSFSEPVPAIFRYSQGIQHYSAYDVELLYNGFCTQTIRPICPGGMSGLLYWDDSNIVDNPATPFINEADPGTGQPLIQLNGCLCQMGGCRTWDNYQLGANPQTCDGEAAGYGNERILNTWWYATSSTLGPILLPVLRAMASGDTLICPGESSNFTVATNPAGMGFTYAWSGPGGFSGMNQSTGPVFTPGTYYVTVTDPVTSCEAVDSIELLVSPAIMTEITYTCGQNNSPNADIDLTVTGGVPPYTYLWNNGAMTQDLMDVPPGLYMVTVTDDNGCTAVDEIQVEPCCMLDVTCPNPVGGQFACITAIPAPNNGLITVNDYCISFTITSNDVNNGATGCGMDTLIVTRTYTITDGLMNTVTCTQVFKVVDDVSPMLTCPANVTIECTASTSPAQNPALGMATATDNCDAMPVITFSDVVTGGACPQESLITRTWTATDECGNSGTCVQLITVDDSVAPAITCPPNLTIQCTASTAPANTGMAMASDNCDGTPTITFSDVSTPGTCPQESVITRTWTATDDCGNSATCVQTITVDDSMAPAITCPPNITIECSASTAPANTGMATASDNCDGTPTITFSDVVAGGACPQESVITRTWTATDDCGNSTACVQLITLDDSMAPAITCPANVTIECTASTAPANTGMATATDNCDGTPTVTFSDVVIPSTACPQESTIQRTWFATDDCGNSSSCLQTITVDDSMAPTIACPSNITIECTASTAPANTGTATASDNCDGTPTITFTDVTAGGACPQEYTITRTWRAQDDCGNFSTCVQSITIDDSLAPAITCPPNITIQCTASTAPASTGTATATDNCDGTPTITFADVTAGGMCPQEYTITRTWTATDDCGNSSTCSQLITIDDSLPPVITFCPANITIACTASTDPAINTALGNASASDNCDAMVAITFQDVMTGGACPQEAVITRTWIATDDCGNSSTCVQLITIDDSLPPVITCPPSVTIQCSASIDPAVNPAVGMATATDNCDASVTVTFADAVSPGGCTNESAVVRTWTATDDCGNSSTCIQLITIDDSQPPVITCPANITISCTASTAPANTGMATASDNCAVTPVITFSDAIAGGACPQEYTITRTWTATDNCGNSSSCVQTIFIDDSTAPMITFCPPNITIECGSETDPYLNDNLGIASATDNCDAEVMVTFSDVVTPSGCPMEFTITRTWIATDACGNSSTCVQTIMADDNTGPTMFCPPNITIECTASTLPANTGMATATDHCDDMPAITYTDATVGGACPQAYSITRTWQGQDDCGNTSTCVQVITIQDTAPPVITCPPNVSIECTANTAPVNTGMATATDSCDPTVTITFSDQVEPGECTQESTITRTWQAIDDCGNAVICTQTIFVSDNTPPVMTCPPNITIECTASTLPANTGMPTVSDNCGFVPAPTYSDVTVIGDCANEYLITRTWSAADNCGNGNTCVQLIYVDDTTPPVAVCQDITLDFDENPVLTISPDEVDGGSTDNCGPVILNLTQSTFDCIQFREDPVQEFMMYVVDQCSNMSTCEFTVTAVGGGGILMQCPEDIFINLETGECDKIVSYVVSAERRCGTEDPVLVQVDGTGYTNGSSFPVGVFKQEYIAYNSQGDTAHCEFYVTVIGFEQTNNAMACNDQVNMSFDEDCELVLNPDMILEGDVYSCFNDYLIEVSNGVSGNYWVMLDASNTIPGHLYTVTITDNKTGNSCWGTLLVEDKRPPEVNCPEVRIYCNTPLDPVFTAPGNEQLPYAPTFEDNCWDNVLYTFQDEFFESCSLDSIIRHWTFTDGSGNSTTCDQRILIIPATEENIVFPDFYQGECFGDSSPDVTGWPTLGGNPLGMNPHCNLWTWYDDITLEDCGGGVKIIRRWTVYNECTDQHLRSSQAIKLTDVVPPSLTCPADMSVGTDFWYCYANVSVPKPVSEDACSPITSYVLTASSGTVVSFGSNYVINGLEPGVHTATWVVTDECGNSASCSFHILVVDNVPPIASCDGHTIVTLTNDGDNGITLVPAEVFNDGSYDNCSPVTLRARRMDSCIDFDWTTDGACIDDIPGGVPPVNSRDRGTVHRPCVPFACCDVGAGPIMVELEVTDAAGNVNYCMVEVEVQDKLSPLVECPPDITVSCDFWFNVVEGTFNDGEGNNDGSLDEDPLSAVFGNMYDAFHYDESDRREIVINDPDNEEIAQPHTWGLDGWADDNCEVNLQVRVRVIDDCSGGDLPANAPDGAVKLIERRFSASDGNEGIAPGTCTQRIWVVDYSPFYISDTDCTNRDRNDGVIWPCDVELTTCPSADSYDPETLNSRPTVFDDACSLVAMTYDDDVFYFTDSACVKILRTWTVLDWCQYDANTGEGRWDYIQVIKVHDQQPPVVLDEPAGPQTFCIEDPNVSLPANNQVFLGEGNPDATACSVHLRLEHLVLETCAERVYYDVKLYPFNGDEFLQVVPRTETPLSVDTASLVFDTKTCAIPSIRTNGLPYNSAFCDAGYYHRILWTIEDGCGNLATMEYVFRLEDCKPPTPVCIEGLSTVVMPAGGEVTVWAVDYNASSYDDCTPKADLVYSFSPDSYKPSATYNCDSLVANGGPIFSVRVWVADAGNDKNCNGTIEWSERNKDFCTTSIMVLDNTNTCDGDMGGIIGTVETEGGDAVREVMVSLKGPAMQSQYLTDETGAYHFYSLPPLVDYAVTAFKDNDHRNGVTTIDLIYIQRHLLGIMPLGSPYKLIAADANNSGSVSAIDIYEIRKLILGRTDRFESNQSWRFVPKSYEFPDPYKPWPFQEQLDLKALDRMALESDFVGVKTGDVNQSVKAHLQSVEGRGSRPLVSLSVEDVRFGEGDEIEVPVYLEEGALAGMQFTVATGALVLERIDGGALNIGSDNYSVFDGFATFSWNEALAQGVSSDKPAFTLVFRADASGRLADQLRFNDAVTASEAYVERDLQLEEADLVIEFTSDGSFEPADAGEFVLYQNRPNPFRETTQIGFSVPGAMHATLSVYNASGHLLAIQEMDAHAGYNEFTVQASTLPHQTVLYYKVDAGPQGTGSASDPSASYSATKKMVIME